MRLLFNDRLAPITSTIGFLETPLAVGVEAFLRWQRSIHEPLGISFTQRPILGGLEPALLALLPLTSILRQRHLFLPTASPWIAFFDNGHQGTDAFSPMSYLAEQTGCRGMRVTAIPDTVQGEFKGSRGRYGGLVLEVYGPDRTEFLNYVRSIALVNDGGRWVFEQSGSPFPFEDVERYAAPRRKERFTFGMLERYLQAMGLSPFDEAFYLPDPGDAAILIEKHGPQPAAIREFSLAEARANF